MEVLISPLFFLFWTVFRKSSESGGLLPPDPDCACEDNKKCGVVTEGEVPVHYSAGHRHSQRKSGHSGGKHCSTGVQVSGQHVTQVVSSVTLRRDKDHFIPPNTFTTMMPRKKKQESSSVAVLIKELVCKINI